MRRHLAMLWSLVVCLECLAADQSVVPQVKSGQAQERSATAKGQQSEPVFLPEDGPSEKDYPELHNLIQVTGQMYVGAEPKTEVAFQQLAELGVRVIISVDGARPNLELAKKHGMRYVHIPIGYDRFSPEATKSFTRAANELGDTVYVHCHHGKHRAPAGAAAICVAQGQMDGQQALKVLEHDGTSKQYPGLWRDVEGFRRPAVNDAIPDLVSEAKIDSVPAAMAKLDRASDNLKAAQMVQSTVPKEHLDLVPGEEAKRLIEGLEEVGS